MNIEQKRLARHALGLPNDGQTSYRNRYAAGLRSDAVEDWEGMVGLGYAVRGDDLSYGRFYHLTRAGADAALVGREKLDLEDFPPIGAH